MIRIVSILLITLFSFSCQKNNDPAVTVTTATEPKTSFYFTVNGKQDSVIGSSTNSSTEGSAIRRMYGSYITHTYYYYQLQSFRYSLTANQTYIALGFNMTKLVTGAYINKPFTGTSDFSVYYSNGAVDTNVLYVAFLDGYYGGTSNEAGTTSITITKIENGYVSGTYSASKLRNASGCTTCPSSVVVTNGAFNNVKILD